MSANPIRVALIGLSARAKTSWAEQAHLAYLLSPRGSSHYSVVALLNSSISAAEAAKARFNLPSSVKVYGDPKALAADPDVDLVVCNTRVDVHFATAEPSLRAGKAVYIEWPLVENLQRAVELMQNKSYPNSIIGLQGRMAPSTLRVKEVLASGAVGTVLSSTIESYGNLLQRDSFPESLSYFGDRKVGGNQINIAFAHLLDYVHEVLGEFSDFQSRLAIHRPVKKSVDSRGHVVGEVKSDVPDFLALHGTLKPAEGKANVAGNAILTATFRHGTPFKGGPGLVWSVHGTEGELRLEAPGPYLMSGDSYEWPFTLRLHDFKSDEVQELEWEWENSQQELPLRARTVGELYERYARWVAKGMPEEMGEEDRFPTLDDAVVRMRELDQIFRRFDLQW